MRTRSSLDLDKLGWHNYLHIPVVDKTSPSIKQLEEGVKFIKKEIDSGGSVYVHCYWGEGRGPTMAAAYLISTGLTSDAALAVIKKVRPFIRPSLSQIDCLQKFQQIYL
jgi:protein-tyrosine phosphatase